MARTAMQPASRIARGVITLASGFPFHIPSTRNLPPPTQQVSSQPIAASPEHACFTKPLLDSFNSPSVIIFIQTLLGFLTTIAKNRVAARSWDSLFSYSFCFSSWHRRLVKMNACRDKQGPRESETAAPLLTYLPWPVSSGVDIKVFSCIISLRKVISNFRHEANFLYLFGATQIFSKPEYHRMQCFIRSHCK